MKWTSRRGRIGAATAVALSLTLAACGGADAGQSGGGAGGGEKGGTFTLGAALALTGGQAELGQDFLTFVEYGAEAANEKYKADGITIEVAPEDTQATAETGASAFNKLASVNNAPIVVTAWSAAVKAMAPIAEDLGVALVNAGAGDSDLEALTPNIANLYTLNSRIVSETATYAAREEGKERAAIVFIDNASGQSAVDDYTKAFEKAGGEVVAVQAIQPGAVDASSQVAKIAAENPDTVHIQTLQEGGAVIRAMQEQGLDDVLVTMQTGVAQDAAVRTAVGDAMDGVVYATGLSKGKDDPTLGPLVERFKKEHDGREPSGLSYMSYWHDISLIYAEVIKRLQDAGDEVNGENIIKELRSGKSFDTPLLGEVTFNDNLLFTPPVRLKEIKDTAAPASDDEVIATVG
jgi:branched-chain amino acid transport system substrate-binding protein